MNEEPVNRWEEMRKLPSRPEVSVFPDREPTVTGEFVTAEEGEFRCPNCEYSLQGIAGNYCPECGMILEYEPVKVFCAADPSIVWAARAVLDQHEVSNVVEAGNYDIFGGLLRGVETMPNIRVPYKFYYEAVSLLDKQFGKRLFKAGERPAPIDRGEDWKCKSCGEDNPSSFEVCWNCGEFI